MSSNNAHPNTTHLYCLMQNRLGAMDRVLGALTHRGILPSRMMTSIQPENTLEMVVSFHGEDDKAVEKLVKFLQKQVYSLEVRVLDARLESPQAVSEPARITPLFVSDVINDYTQRRMAHANNG